MKSTRLKLILGINIVTVTVLALVVRALTATWTGLTTDEANGVIVAVTGSWADMIQHLKEDGNAPLLYVLLRLYAEPVGHSDLAVKLFALVMGTMQVPISYWICRRFLSQELSLQVAILLALCPPLVRYGTLVRSYSLISILALISTWTCMEVLTRRRSILWPVLYGVSTAALVYSHYWGAFVPIGQTCLLAIGLWRRWFNLDNVKHWLAGVAVSVVAFLPWTPILIYQFTHVLDVWDMPPLPSFLFTHMASFILVGNYYTLQPLDQLALLISSVLVLFVLFCPRTLQTQTFDGRFWKAVVVCGYGAGLLVSLVEPAMRDRYLTPFAPLMIIVFLTTCHELLGQSPRLVRLLVPVAVWMPIWIPALTFLASEPETGAPAIIAKINRDFDRQKDLVVISWPIIVPAINFYLPEDIEVVTFPDIKPIKFNRWDGMLSRLRDPSNLQALIEEMRAALARGGRIWLVDRYHSVRRRDFTNETLLKDLKYMDTELCRMDQVRTWLSLNAEQVGSNQLAPGRDFSVFLSIYEPGQESSSPAEAEDMTGPQTSDLSREISAGGSQDAWQALSGGRQEAQRH